MDINAVISDYANNIQKYTIFFTIFVAIFLIVKRVRNKQKITIDELFVKSLAGSSIPNGIMIVICSLYPQYMNKLNDIYLYLLVVGLGLIVISFKEAFFDKEQPSANTNPPP